MSLQRATHTQTHRHARTHARTVMWYAAVTWGNNCFGDIARGVLFGYPSPNRETPYEVTVTKEALPIEEHSLGQAHPVPLAGGKGLCGRHKGPVQGKLKGISFPYRHNTVVDVTTCGECSSLCTCIPSRCCAQRSAGGGGGGGGGLQ